MVRLLLVDDHEIVRAGLRRALEHEDDFEIAAELGDGLSVFAWLQQEQADLLLIDITMPNFEPIEDITRIKQHDPNMKILVVSAYDDDVYVKGLLSIGVDGYHLKDQPLTDLQLAVKRILAGEKWVSSRLLQRLAMPDSSQSHDHIHLTSRQRDILRLLANGLDNRTIARELNLSIKTIENHLTRIYKDLDVHSRLEALNFLMQNPQVLAISGTNVADSTLPERHPSNNGTILVVDDNARYRQQLMRMIGSISPASLLYEAENIEQATLFAQRIKPRFALVDVVLGDESGIQCLQRIRNVSSQTRVVLISAYPDSEFHRRGLEAGAMAFVDKKNLDTKALRQILRDMELV